MPASEALERSRAVRQMRTYSPGAARVVHTLQAAEDNNETIWAVRAIAALADLSPIESAIARALRMRTVWDETMRNQTRAGARGNPEAAHLLPRSGSGFRLQLLLERAQRVADKEGYSQIAERHLASALVELLAGDLPHLGVNGQQLVAEVTAVERGEQDQQVKQGLEWEELRFARAQEEAFRDAEVEHAKLRANLQARRGLFDSSMHIGGVIESHVRMMERLVQARIEIRRELVGKVQELGSEAQLVELRLAIDAYIDAAWVALPGIVAGSYRGQGSEDHFRGIINAGQWADRPLRLKSAAERDLKMLMHEVGLGMVDSKRPEVVLNIKDSNVAALNMGSVKGNIQAFVASLQSEGNEDLAQGLKELIERVAEAEELGAQRTELIEALTTIGEQAALPQVQRRPGLVRTLMKSLGPALTHAANLAQIWSAVAPALARHFGFPWS